MVGDQQCVACHGSGQLCVRLDPRNCAWCIGHGHECYLPLEGDSLHLESGEPDAAAELLEAVIARVLEHMRGEIPDHVSAGLHALILRLPALVLEVAPGTSPAAVLACGRGVYAHMRAYLQSQIEGDLARYAAQYRATLGPYALGIVRGFLSDGARGVEDVGLVVQGVGNRLREMREGETELFHAFVEGLVRREVHAKVAAGGVMGPMNRTTPPETSTACASEKQCAEVGREVIQQVLARLPALKAAVSAEVLAEARLSDRLAWWVGRDLRKELDAWEVRLRTALAERTPQLRHIDARAWVALCEARVKEHALQFAGGIVVNWHNMQRR